MKLQLALDTVSSTEGIALMEKAADHVDIIEIGTPLIIREGVAAVSAMKKAFPNHLVLADLKIMDAGDYEASEAFAAGADIVSVLAVTHDSTVKGCVEAAKRYGGKVLADMICVADIPARAKELEALGVDYLCVHTAFDEQAGGADPLDELAQLMTAVDKKHAAVAGGLKRATAPAVAALAPEVVVVGGAILNAPDPAAEAKAIKEILQ